MNRRITEIEGIRGVLSLIVLGGHIHAAPVFWFGGCMEVFFCISGFLITRIILADGGNSGFLRNYFIRRALRIWPMYYVAMVFALLVYAVTGGFNRFEPTVPFEWQPNAWAVIAPLFFLQNVEMYLNGPRAPYLLPFDHSWSVALEEQFYFSWPFLLLFGLKRMTPRARVLFAMGCLLLTVVLRWHYRDYGARAVWLLGSRLDGFVFGAVLAYIEVQLAAGFPVARVRSLFRWLWIWPALALTPFIARGYLSYYFDVQLHIPSLLLRTVLEPYFNFALLGCALVGYCAFRDDAAPVPTLSWLLNWRPLQYLGTISYSTYLLHVPIVCVLIPFLIDRYDLPFGSSVVLGFGVSLALAHMTYTFVEAQAMRLKKRFSYKAAARPATKTVDADGAVSAPAP